MKFRILPVILLSLILVLSQGTHAQTRYYVNNTTGSDGGAGTTWGTAFRNFAYALSVAKTSSAAEVDIWVAAGTYGPLDGVDPLISTVRKDTAFLLYRGNGVGKSLKVYGGFAGTETSLSARTFSSITYFVPTSDEPTSSTNYHIGIIAGIAPAADSIVIDGISFAGSTIQDTGNKKYNGIIISNAYGAGVNMTNDSTGKIAFRNCNFWSNSMQVFLYDVHGGGLSVVNATLSMYNCSFSGNNAMGSTITFGSWISGNTFGGAVYAESATLKAVKCSLTNNYVQGGRDMLYYSSYGCYGGAMHLTASTCTFDSCTFGNNISRGSHGEGYGGGISISGCSPQFNNCTFSKNTSTGYLFIDNATGGGVYCINGSPVFTGCLFAGNQSLGGPHAGYSTPAGIGNGGGITFYGSSPTFNSCTFSRNAAHGGYVPGGEGGAGYGGSIYSEYSNIRIKKCTFIADTGTTAGGAIWNTSGNLTIDSTSFDSCYTAGNGIIYQIDSNLVLTHDIFQHGNAYSGGAVFVHGSGYKILANGNIFFRNTSGYQGGAMAFSALDSFCTDTLINNIFVKNTASMGGALVLGDYYHFICNNTFFADTANGYYGLGGGIYLGGSSAIDTIVNNIFYQDYSLYGDRDTSIAGSSPYYFAFNSGSATNPYFKDTINLVGADNTWGTTDDGLELNKCSWFIDAGSGRYVPANDTKDIARQARIQGTTVNYGAYESVAPGYITGPSTVCVGSTIILADTTASGTWSSSNPSIALVGSTGIVTGVSQGIATITYLLPCGTRYVTAYITVQRRASVITGVDSVCMGSTITLADSATGGTWSSISPSVSLVGSTGVITGLTAGTAIVTYSITNVCGTTTATKSISVQRTASVITGIDSVCTGATVTLSDSASGGVWSSIYTGIATVGTSGIVTGVTQGIDTIVYTLTNACGSSADSIQITVARRASVITGASVLCTGTTITLSDSTIGGTWTSSVPAVAAISTGGDVTAADQGRTVITYAVTNACGTSSKTDTLTIQRPAAVITGTNTLCTGATTTLADSTTGGSWLSSVPSVATVGSTGIVTGLVQGFTDITYSVTNICGTSNAVVTVTVERLAAIITGNDSLCTGVGISLADSAAGGSWISSNTGVATVNSSGTVAGVSAGAVTITYDVTNSCGHSSATKTMEIDAPVSPITGSDTICLGNTLTLTDTSAGGIWQSSDTTIAGVSGRVVTGVAAGMATISYSLTNACGTTVSQQTVYVLTKETCDSLSGVLLVNTAMNITVYPNPTTGILFIQTPVTVNAVVKSIDGRQLLSLHSAHNLDIAGLPNGIYMLMLYSETGELLKVEKIIRGN